MTGNPGASRRWWPAAAAACLALVAAVGQARHTTVPGTPVSPRNAERRGPLTGTRAAGASTGEPVPASTSTTVRTLTSPTTSPASGPQPVASRPSLVSSPGQPSAPRCSRGDGPPVPDRAALNALGPDRVASSLTQLMWTTDTATDVTARAAMTRAPPWLTGPFAASVRAAQPVDGGDTASGQWSTWRAHCAYTLVTVTFGADDGALADSATAADRQLVVSVVPVGRDGWQDTPSRLVVFVHLTGGPGHWKAATVDATPTS